MNRQEDMLSIKIDNPEMEKSIQHVFGDNEQAMVNAFVEFIRLQTVKQDVAISIEQLDSGQKKSLQDVMKAVRIGVMRLVQ